MYCRSDCYYVVIMLDWLKDTTSWNVPSFHYKIYNFSKDIFEIKQELRKSKPGRFYDMPIVNHHHGACRLPSFNS